MDVAGAIEHTLLSADATRARVERLCDEALEHGFHGVCVNPVFVEAAAARLRGSACRVVTVVGFPLGATLSHVKATEARATIEAGAHEVDMVLAIGRALDGDTVAVAEDIRAVRRATIGAVLKVIVETGYFADDAIAEHARIAVAEGADFVKTSTGFGPRGASVHDVELLRRATPAHTGIKASGGIRTRDSALAMLRAGATRLGTSSGVALVRP